MKRLYRPARLLVLLPYLFTLTAYAQRGDADGASRVITPALMKGYIAALASDSMRGRKTPSPGLDSAAAFIVREFQASGLQPVNGSWYQELDYCYIDLGADQHLTLASGERSDTFALRNDFVPYDISGSGTVESGVVFAGYGITAPEFHYDDYAGLDVRGKIVVVLRQEPGQVDTSHAEFEGREFTRYSGIEAKANRAAELGAAALVVLSGPLQFTSLKPRGYPWPSLSRTLPRDVLPLRQCTPERERIPVVHAGQRVTEALFESVDSLRRIQQRIESRLKPSSFVLTGTAGKLGVSLERKPMGGRNVVGVLPGRVTGEEGEALVVGAHYDHVGWITPERADTDFIFNGADDNASGTAGVVAVARAFSAMGKRPRRTVLFIAFAGEEKGLLGSATYVRNPLFPLEQTVAMLNLDMISRNHPDSLMLIGAKQNPGLVKVVRKQNRKVGLVLSESKSNRMGGGSDHYNFYLKGIPDLFFFTGMHEDYHQTGDNPDRVDAAKAARVARLAFLTAWHIANDRKQYKIIKGVHEE